MIASGAELAQNEAMDVGSIKRWAGGSAANDNKKGPRRMVEGDEAATREKVKAKQLESTAGTVARVDPDQAAKLYREAAAIYRKYPGPGQSYARVLEKKASELEGR